MLVDCARVAEELYLETTQTSYSEILCSEKVLWSLHPSGCAASVQGSFSHLAYVANAGFTLEVLNRAPP